MTPPDECPNAFTLQQYAAGALDGSDADGVAFHVAACERCRGRVAELRADGVTDTPGHVRTLTQAAPEKDDDDSAGLEFLEESNDPDAIGRIGQYQVSRELGRGGMGVVLDAFDPVLHRRVAIKVLAPYLASSKRSRQRFLREARAAAAIRHPNVVTIHAVEPHVSLPYLVMEYIPGRTLRDRIRLGPIGLTAMLRIATQIAAGLAAAHGEGVIHRDVKPGNILLEDGIERVKITDFGLALVALDAEQLSTGDRPVGTPAYMSPEQVAGGKVDARSDLFSLGCVLYAMGAGNSPFQGNSPLEMSRKITDLVPPPLHEVNPDVPHFFSDIVARLLEKDPAKRLQTAKEIHDLLLEYLSIANQGGSAELPRHAPKLPPPPPPPTPAPTRRRRPWLPIALIAAAAVLVLGVAIWHPWSPRGSAHPIGGAPEVATDTILTVAQDGSGDYANLREALEHAGPGSTVRILDAATYRGPLRITAPQRDLIIESPAGATLEDPGNSDAVITFEYATNVTLRGVRVKAHHVQHAISIKGACPGLTLETVAAEVPEDSPRSAILLWTSPRGSAERPITIRESRIRGGEIGLVFRASTDRPAAHVRIQNCRFETVFGVHVALHEAITDVTFAGNVFNAGKAGLSFDISEPQGIKGLTVANNTFCGVAAWLAADQGTMDHTDLHFIRNLIVKCKEFRINDPAPAWFEGNWWIKSDGLDEAKAQLVAAIKERVPLLSEDPAHADFLRPAPGAMPAEAHVGAFAPKPHE